MRAFAPLSVFAMLLALAAARSPAPPAIFLVQARSGRVLSFADGSSICPSSVPHGVSLMCVPPPWISSATLLFYIDTARGKMFGDRARSAPRRIAPSYLFGATDSTVHPFRNWKDYQGKIRAVCQSKSGRNANGGWAFFHWEAKLNIDCRVPTSVPTVAPLGMRSAPRKKPTPVQTWKKPELRVVAAHTDISKDTGKLLRNGDEICEKDYSKGGFTVLCKAPSSSKSARFYVDGKLVHKESARPFLIAGDFQGKASAWTSYVVGKAFTLKCVTDQAASEVKVSVRCPDEDRTMKKVPRAMPMPVSAAQPKKCVKIDAKKTKLSAGWTMAPAGIWFQKNSKKTSIEAMGKYPVSYVFIAPVTATYAFVIDMTTSHGTEHNDVWARFPDGGFRLNRFGKFRGGASTSWTKVYHNKRSRAMLSNTVDHNPHSMSTKKVLQAGSKYKVEIAGRSSKVQVHRIILFPCVGSACNSGSRIWRKDLSACA